MNIKSLLNYGFINQLIAREHHFAGDVTERTKVWTADDGLPMS